MIRSSKHLLLIAAFLPLLQACSPDPAMEFTDSPIIEAYLSPGDFLNLKVSRQVPFSEGVSYSADNIDALLIQVRCNNELYTLSPLGDGWYIDSSRVVRDGDEFDLSFQYNGEEVRAYTYVPSKPQNPTQSAIEIYLDRIDSTTFGPPGGGGAFPDPIEITWDNPDNSYHLVLVENVESVLDPIRDFGDNEPPGNIFRKSPTAAGEEVIRSQEFQYFGKHRVVIYHVLPDYAALYDRNSTSSQNLTSPSSSIANGYGIFTGLNADTLWVMVREN